MGPLLKRKYPDIKLMVHDDQVYSLKSRLEQSGAGVLDSEFVDGIAFHWSLPPSLRLHSYTLTITHSHTLTITCTCCDDEIKGIQDQELFSCSFSDSPSLLLSLDCCSVQFKLDARSQKIALARKFDD